MSERNKPLVDFTKKRPSPYRAPTADELAEEEYGRQMDRWLPRIASVLGVCANCFEDLMFVEGKWICRSCSPETLDIIAEDLREKE